MLRPAADIAAKIDIFLKAAQCENNRGNKGPTQASFLMEFW